MNWIDIASIVFVCVTMNHLGLIEKVEEMVFSNGELRGVTGKLFLILSCPKCSTFWCVLIYTTILSHHFIAPLAISFLCSYLAIWLELLEGYIDTLYMKLYETIYPNTDNDTPASDADNGHSADTVS